MITYLQKFNATNCFFPTTTSSYHNSLFYNNKYLLHVKPFTPSPLILRASYVTFPYGNKSHEEVFNPEMFYVDKTLFIKEIEDFGFTKGTSKAVISLRPRRFGKSLFLDTMKEYYDINNAPKPNSNEEDSRFYKLFGHLKIIKEGKKTPLAHSMFVLPLDFSGLLVTSFERYESSLNSSINNSIAAFKDKYGKATAWVKEIEIDTNNSNSTFTRLVNKAENNGAKVFVAIDEYDSSLNTVLSDTAKKSELNQMDSRFRTFF